MNPTTDTTTPLYPELYCESCVGRTQHKCEGTRHFEGRLQTVYACQQPHCGAVRVADAPVKADADVMVPSSAFVGAMDRVATLATEVFSLRNDLDTANATIEEPRAELTEAHELTSQRIDDMGDLSATINELRKELADTVRERDKAREEIADGRPANENLCGGEGVIECPSDCDGCSCHSMPPCSHCVDGHGEECPGCGACVDTRADVIKSLRSEIASLEAQAEQDQANAGLLCDVCDAAFGDPQRAERHGYAGILERVLETRANVTALLVADAELRAELTEAHAANEALRDQLTAANCDAAPEPVERNGRPHVHRADRAIDDWHDVCLCGATRRWARDSTMRPCPLAWVEPSPVSEAKAVEDESELPLGWSVMQSAELPGWWCWYGASLLKSGDANPGKDPQGRDRKPSRAEAVAACWTAHRAQQPATVSAPEATKPAPYVYVEPEHRCDGSGVFDCEVGCEGCMCCGDRSCWHCMRGHGEPCGGCSACARPAPAPTLEAQLAEARHRRVKAYAAADTAMSEVDCIKAAIAARDGKAGA